MSGTSGGNGNRWWLLWWRYRKGSPLGAPGGCCPEIEVFQNDALPLPAGLREEDPWRPFGVNPSILGPRGPRSCLAKISPSGVLRRSWRWRGIRAELPRCGEAGVGGGLSIASLTRGPERFLADPGKPVWNCGGPDGCGGTPSRFGPEAPGPVIARAHPAHVGPDFLPACGYGGGPGSMGAACPFLDSASVDFLRLFSRSVAPPGAGCNNLCGDRQRDFPPPLSRPGGGSPGSTSAPPLSRNKNWDRGKPGTAGPRRARRARGVTNCRPRNGRECWTARIGPASRGGV